MSALPSEADIRFGGAPGGMNTADPYGGATWDMWSGIAKSPDYPSALTNYNTFQQSSFLPPWQASIPSPWNSPATIDAIKQQAALYGYDPAAYVAMVQMETQNNPLDLWNPAANTGQYYGLNQMAQKTFEEAPGGMLGGLTWPQYQLASPASQIGAYGDWLNLYTQQGGPNSAAALVTGGIGSLDPAMQAAIMMGTQFTPNATGWPTALAAGDMNVPISIKQAQELGNYGSPTIGTMYDAFTNTMAQWPQQQLYTNYYGPYGGMSPTSTFDMWGNPMPGTY
jgi:hypothetical protein